MVTENLASLMDLIPTKADDRPVSSEVWERLKGVVGPAHKTYQEWVKDPENVRITDNLALSLRLLEHVGCSEEACGSAKAKEPMHLYFHLNTQCEATTDHNAWVEKKGACPWCSGGIQSNTQRIEYFKARAEYIKQHQAEEIEASE